MQHCTKLALTINKGGVGKTTSACALSQILALGGYKVLEIDMDPQGNTSRIFGILEDLEGLDYEKLYCSLIEKEEVMQFIVPSNFDNIDIIPSSRQMKRMDVKIYDAMKENPWAITYFKKNIDLVSDDYDFIIMDNAPADNDLSKASMILADKVLLPINTDNMSFEGIGCTIEAVEEINEKYDANTVFEGIFMTRVKSRTTLYKDLFESNQIQFGDYFIPVSIRDCNAVNEANTAFVPLFRYAKKCTAFVDYVELISKLKIMDKKHYQTLSNHILE